MAINVPNQNYTDWAEQFNFTYKDVVIGGKMVRGTIRIPEHKVSALYSDHEFKQYMKSSMATLLAEYMISNGLVEFTQMRDNATLDIVVNARCYLAPSDQVKVLRMHYADT
jgi:hypothetical protein